MEKNQDRSLEEFAVAETGENIEAGLSSVATDLESGEEAKSLVCNECQRRFRDHAQAELHASKSGHVDFSESIEEILPLTEEEKRAKLDDMRKRLAEKRAGDSEQDKADKKRNEASQSWCKSSCIRLNIYLGDS